MRGKDGRILKTEKESELCLEGKGTPLKDIEQGGRLALGKAPRDVVWRTVRLIRNLNPRGMMDVELMGRQVGRPKGWLSGIW